MTREFREVKTFKTFAVRPKTEREYERLFENLMTYTSFTKIDDIKNQTDLNDFFGDVSKDAKSRGRKFTNSLLFQDKLSGALRRLRGKPKHKVMSRSQEVIEGKIFTDFDVAKEHRMTAVNEKGIEVFKTKVIYKGKSSVRYRDKKGIFRKQPKGEDE